MEIITTETATTTTITITIEETMQESVETTRTNTNTVSFGLSFVYTHKFVARIFEIEILFSDFPFFYSFDYIAITISIAIPF